MRVVFSNQTVKIKHVFGNNRFLNDFGREENFSIFYEKLLDVIKEVDSWSNCVAEMPAIVFSDGSLNNDSFVSALFHVFFDIQWSLIEMAYMATNKQKYDHCNQKLRDNLLEILITLQENICSDLIYLGFRKFSDVSRNPILNFFFFSVFFSRIWLLMIKPWQLTPNDWSGYPPFNCTCIRELWFMLQMMMKTKSSFHSFILQRYQSMIENTTLTFCQDLKEAKRLQLSSKDPLTLLWICTHISKLSGFNLSGTWDSNFSRVSIFCSIDNHIWFFHNFCHKDHFPFL